MMSGKGIRLLLAAFIMGICLPAGVVRAETGIAPAAAENPSGLKTEEAEGVTTAEQPESPAAVSLAGVEAEEAAASANGGGGGGDGDARSRRHPGVRRRAQLPRARLRRTPR